MRCCSRTVPFPFVGRSDREMGSHSHQNDYSPTPCARTMSSGSGEFGFFDRKFFTASDGNLRAFPAMTRTLVIEGSGELWGSERALLDLLDVLPRTDLAICCPAQMPLNDELNRRRLLVLPYYVYGLHLKSRWH